MSFGLFSFLNTEERFVDKQQKLNNVLNSQKNLNEEFTSRFEKFVKLENLRLSLIKYRNNNAILRDLVKAKQENIQKLHEIKKENEIKNRSLKLILPKYEDKVNKLGEYVMIAVEKNDNLRKKSLEQLEKLKLLRQSNIEKIIKYIFPITIKESNNSDSDLTLAGSSDSNLSREYYISNGPCLPSNRSYFYEYCKWLVYNKDGNSGTGTGTSGNNEDGINMTHKAYAIVAALTYIVQLINSLSIYLDVRLPHRITSNDFCKVILNEQQFRKKVSKLNYNAAYFASCVTGRFLKSNAQSCSIMENVLQIINDRKEDCQQLADSLSLSFTDPHDDHGSDMDSDNDDDDDTSHKEDWENVSNVVEITANQSIAIPYESNNNSNNVAMSSTIMNNITSVANSLFWNRWNK